MQTQNKKDKIDFYDAITWYFNEEYPVHISLKTGGFKNGNIKEVKVDFFLLDDFREGEQLIFFQEIKSVSKFIKEAKEDGGGLRKS